jgi:hypothetical protein
MLLKDYNGLVLPPQTYFSYEPLPETWEKILDKPDVVHPQEPTSEMEAFSKLPTYKRESTVEGNQSLATFHKMEESAPHLDNVDDQGLSQYKSQDYSASNDYSVATDEAKGKSRFTGDSRENSRLRLKQHDMSHAIQSKKDIKDRQIDECHEDLSEKEEKTDRGTEADEQDTRIRASSVYFGARERQEVADQMLFDELDIYNPKLNREVSRILNEQH